MRVAGCASLGDAHPATLISTCNLGQLLVDEGSDREAVELLEGIGTALREAFGDGDRRRIARWGLALGEARANLAASADERAAAVATLEAAYQVLVEVEGAGGAEARNCAGLLAALHGEWSVTAPDGGHGAQAERWSTLAGGQD